MENHPALVLKIAKIVQKHLQKLPTEEFLKAAAYKWLQYLHKSGIAMHYAWYPRHAVKVAHRAFGLKGKLATFQKYLDHPSRIKHISSATASSSNASCARATAPVRV